MNSIVLQFKDKACRLKDSQRSLLHDLPYLGWVFSPKGVCNHFLNKDEYASHGFWYLFLSSLLYSLVKKSLMVLTHVSATRAECSYEKYTPTLGGCRRPLWCITQSPERKHNLEDLNKEGHKIIQWRNSSVYCVGRDVLSMGALLNSWEQSSSVWENSIGIWLFFCHKTIKPKLI